MMISIRVLGIPQLIYSNCSTARAFPDIRQLKFQFNLHWTFYMHAVLLLISYPLLVFTYQINEVDFFLTHFRKMKARNRVRHHKPRKHDSNKVLQIGGVPIGLYLTEIGDMFYYLGFVLVNFTLLVRNDYNFKWHLIRIEFTFRYGVLYTGLGLRWYL